MSQPVHPVLLVNTNLMTLQQRTRAYFVVRVIFSWIKKRVHVAQMDGTSINPT